MDYTVYFLYSKKDLKLYVGCTSNLQYRLQQHADGNVQATKNRRPLILIHKESFLTAKEAFEKEKFLKSLWGAREKKRILKTYLNGLARTKFTE